MDYRIEFGNRLKELRKNGDLTQKEVAAFLDVDTTTYAHYESGRRTPDLELLIRLAKYYNLTDELLGVKRSNPDDFNS